ncbi:hypothetical protein [Vibrio cholerae]|uniref:hypothetical protein n=1 Tax=Vibrio cholerae TaxID=666 RepID=UPI0018F0C4CB|nr:hypothetical protein [Vibrio cholerae]MBJ6887597.1 hypothetical protein [Vibrio cholerae]HAS3611739.1 hypothetical protein [Vibrio cholerae]
MKTGLEKCLDALERIKKNTPNLNKFADLPRNKVTAAVISQEAGFDSGYLKKKRPQHQEIISLIESYRHSDTGSTLSVREKIEREKRKTERLQARLEQAEDKLNKALARELLLLDQIDRMEQELLKRGL